jgi:hypothetical protein
VRAIAFVAAALLLSGCDTGEGWVPADDRTAELAPPTAPPAMHAPNLSTPMVSAPVASPSAPAPTARVVAAPVAPAPITPPAPIIDAGNAPTNTIDTHCQAVARQRASDARANGYSFEMESTVYDGTYKTCVAWDTQRAPGATP